MGGCFAKTNDKEIPDTATPTTKATNSVQQTEIGFSGANKTEASKLDFVTRWKDDICAICARPISALPVNTDVPRLCRKVLVVNGATVIFDGSLKSFANQPVNNVVRTMFESIAKFLNDNATLEAIKRDFDKIVVSTGDAGTHLASWFTSIIQNAEGDANTPPTILLFKTVHQRCIFPAFYCVRELLQESIGKFKDKRGTWNVRIDLDPENLSIIHTKRQEAVEMLGEGPKFEFDWNLSLKILKDTFMVDAKGLSITLTDLVCSNLLDKDAIEKITATFAKNQLVS